MESDPALTETGPHRHLGNPVPPDDGTAAVGDEDVVREVAVILYGDPPEGVDTTGPQTADRNVGVEAARVTPEDRAPDHLVAGRWRSVLVELPDHRLAVGRPVGRLGWYDERCTQQYERAQRAD